jgi:hypothetical protein
MRDPDAYEKNFMVGKGRVVARDKSLTPWWWNAIIGLIGLVALTPIFAGVWWLSLFLLPFWFMMWILFLVLRITVTTEEVIVQMGLWGPRIPVAAITQAEALDYDWKRYGGWGIKRASDGEWAYNMGDKRVARVRWREGNEERSLVLGSKDPEALVRAIDEARGARVRVAAEPEEAVPIEEEEERAKRKA